MSEMTVLVGSVLLKSGAFTHFIIKIGSPYALP